MPKYYHLKDAFVYLKNPQKYRGSRPCTLRSGYEITWVLKFLDVHPSVLEWGSESVIVKYMNPVDERMHRYFVDFWMKVREADGSIKEYLLEVKPKKQTMAPKLPKKKSRRYLEEVNTYIKNTAKWEAATKFADQKNMVFKLITEEDLPG